MAIDENGKVTFTPEEQAEVDRVIGERLGRERQKYEGFEDLKDLPEILKDFGYTGTPAEIKQAVKDQAEQFKKQKELESLKEEAKNTGSSPELLAEIKALKTEIADLKNKTTAQEREAAARKQAHEDGLAQVKEFEEKYADIDVKKLLKNEKFAKFVKRANPKLTLVEVYEDFQELVGGAEAEAMAKIKGNVARSTASGREKGDGSGGTYGLTERQQALARDGGMTNKEYADILKHVKK